MKKKEKRIYSAIFFSGITCPKPVAEVKASASLSVSLQTHPPFTKEEISRCTDKESCVGHAFLSCVRATKSPHMQIVITCDRGNLSF